MSKAKGGMQKVEIAQKIYRISNIQILCMYVCMYLCIYVCVYVRNVRFKEDPVSLVDDRVKTQIKNQARKKQKKPRSAFFFLLFFSS